ncbi:MFS transporter [Amycolatopsis echigonensis]|uniref:MFS transporter n=1 Tax=Amycolatopsis echigonensis TaxID=2576905 RepID=A0A8E1VYB3_9PSEU|nr:MFS transporter [Amycolatopsis echigonensis]MBB2500561.1 MFS transporter [Amycolatopsis echigonensis]
MRSLRDALSLNELKGKQERFFAISMSILYLGTGLSYSSLAIYLIRYVGLRPSVYGAGMSVAAVAGIAAGPLIGWLADRRDGHVVYAALAWLMGIATLSLAMAPGWLALVLLSVLVACGRGSAAVIGALIGRAVDAEHRVPYRAVLKSLSNVAIVVGLSLGALVLAFGSIVAFRISFAVEAMTFVVAGLLVRTAGKHATPRPSEPTRHAVPGAGRSNVLRDRRFVLLTIANGVLTLSESMITIALPLWVLGRMHVPLWLVSVALVLQTSGVVVLQLPVSRRVADVPAAARAARCGAILLAVAAVLFPVGALADRGVIAAAAIAGIALAVVGGEVLCATASWCFLYDLAPESALGRYQGFYNMGFDLSLVVAPSLFGWFASTGTQAGWFGLAAVFLATGLALAPITRRSTMAAATPAPERAQPDRPGGN